MNSKKELKEIDIKNRACYYFDDLTNGKKINFSNILQIFTKSYMKIFQFIIFCIKLPQVQNHCVLGLIK